jgi:hypothetical protein
VIGKSSWSGTFLVFCFWLIVMKWEEFDLKFLDDFLIWINVCCVTVSSMDGMISNLELIEL